MAKIKFAGPLSYRLKSFLTLSRISIATQLRHFKGQKMAPDWDAHFETGILFWRHQFTNAMQMGDMAKGRALFDSLQTYTDDVYAVTSQPQNAPQKAPKGIWYTPKTQQTDTALLYFHGGGYSFSGAISQRYAAMLCHHTGARLFAPEYRLTPEHPHPAQAEDALEAWHYLTNQIDPKKIILIGDSAGGHMALMLLQTLKAQNLPQPAHCIALCPWTDIGNRGASLMQNNPTDLVQGWMALQFGEWLDPKVTYGRKALSPIHHDFTGTAPIYIQTGGREILHDMIVDFARIQRQKGADITLESWEDMPHNFQAYDTMKQSSTEALNRIKQLVNA